MRLVLQSRVSVRCDSACRDGSRRTRISRVGAGEGDQADDPGSVSHPAATKKQFVDRDTFLSRVPGGRAGDAIPLHRCGFW